MFSMFSRAQAGLNLSPAERAIVKLVEGFLVAGLVAAAPLVAQLLANPNLAAIDWPTEARLVVGTFAVAALMACVKYCKAHMDSPIVAPLATLATIAATDVAHATGVSGRMSPLVAPLASVSLPTASYNASPVVVSVPQAPAPVTPPDGVSASTDATQAATA